MTSFRSFFPRAGAVFLLLAAPALLFDGCSRSHTTHGDGAPPVSVRDGVVAYLAGDAEDRQQQIDAIDCHLDSWEPWFARRTRPLEIHVFLSRRDLDAACRAAGVSECYPNVGRDDHRLFVLAGPKNALGGLWHGACHRNRTPWDPNTGSWVDPNHTDSRWAGWDAEDGRIAALLRAAR